MPIRQELKDIARAYGADIMLTPGGHVRLTLPNGAKIITSSTAGDVRSIRNLRSRLARASREGQA